MIYYIRIIRARGENPINLLLLYLRNDTVHDNIIRITNNNDTYVLCITLLFVRRRVIRRFRRERKRTTA
jgi:hypothetical protein